MTKPTIRPQRDADQANLRRAFVELQEFERLLHDSRLPGAEIAIPYVEWMQKQVADRSGEVFVAEADGVFQGLSCTADAPAHPRGSGTGRGGTAEGRRRRWLSAKRSEPC